MRRLRCPILFPKYVPNKYKNILFLCLHGFSVIFLKKAVKSSFSKLQILFFLLNLGFLLLKYILFSLINFFNKLAFSVFSRRVFSPTFTSSEYCSRNIFLKFFSIFQLCVISFLFLTMPYSLSFWLNYHVKDQ